MARYRLGGALAVALAFVTACSGGGGGTGPVQVAATQTPSKNGTVVEAKIVLPNAVKRAHGKQRDYVSPFTKGLIVAVNLGHMGISDTPYSLTGYDLTTNNASSTCSVNSATNETTCTIFFVASPTSSTQNDYFSIYAYDMAQTVGALTPSYTPAGNLLSEDTGIPGRGDPVPAPTGSPNGPIVAGTTNSLLFVLKPVVAVPKASINDTFAGATTPLVLSVPGSGGQSNLLNVDGYDAGDNMIQSDLVAGSGDDVYVNPISDSIVPSGSYALSASPITSALNDFVTVAYTPATGDQPTSATTAAPQGTLSISDSLTNGGFGNDSSFPAAGQTVAVAPLYAYAPTSTATATGFSTSVYALQGAVPTLSTGYVLTAQPTSATNDCSAYGVSGPTAGAAGTSQQGVFAVATTGLPAIGTTCQLVLSDGISSTTITFAPDGTHTP